MIRRSTVVALMTLVFSIAGLPIACDRGEPGRIPPPPGPVEVTVSHPVATGVAVSFPATLRAVERAELATRISGTVIRVAVDVGSRVSLGDALVLLDDGDLEARIRGAEAALERARRARDRMEALHAEAAATDQELEDARARFATAEAAIEEARAQRAYTVLRAPFSGVVTARSVEPGDLAVPGRPVLTLAGIGALEAFADLPASWEGRVAIGDAVVLVRPETEERITARIARLAPALESTSRSFRLEATLPAGTPRGLLPGTFLRFELPDPGRSTLWIPADAVIHRGQLTAVLTVADGTARQRWVRTGIRREAAVEILAGLTSEEVVVRRPPTGLGDGHPLTVVRKAPFEVAETGDAIDAANDSGGR